MATYDSKTSISLVAGADLSSSQYTAVRITAANTVQTGTLAGKCVGIVQNAPASGHAAEVCISGACIALAGGTFSAGDPIEATATGTVQKLSGNGYKIGTALEAGSSGSLVKVLIEPEYMGLDIARLTDDGGITAGLIVKSGTADNDVAVAGANSKPVGVCAVTSTNNNPAYIYTSGICEVTSGAAFDRGASLVPDAAGKAQAAGYLGGRYAVGIALDTATGADESITMLVCPHEVHPDKVVKELTAGADLSSSTGLLVKVGAADNAVIAGTAGSDAVGLLLNAPILAGTAIVQVAGVAACTSGAAVTLGARVECDAAGKVIDATGTANYNTVGLALNDTAGADETVNVLLQHNVPVKSGTKTIRSNCFVGMDTNWTINEGGWAALPASQTNEYLLVAIPNLREGDTITAFRVLGALDSAGNNVSVEAKLRTLEKAAAATPTSADVGTLAAITKTAAYALDDGASGLAVVVTDDLLYHVWIQATTAAATTATVTGVEVDITEVL